jgi:F0F1-type ATP synthase assembly protein I
MVVWIVMVVAAVCGSLTVFLARCFSFLRACLHALYVCATKLKAEASS